MKLASKGVIFFLIIICVGLYLLTDSITTYFFIFTSMWALFRMPSFPFLVAVSIALISAMVTLQLSIGKEWSTEFATATYYLLCAYLISETSNTLAETSKEKSANRDTLPQE